MELKRNFNGSKITVVILLIVPYGIETVNRSQYC